MTTSEWFEPCENCRSALAAAAIKGYVGITLCGACQVRRVEVEASKKAARQASLGSAPWEWDSRYGEWGLWDSAGNALIIEGSFVDGEIAPRIQATTAAAPEMEALLRWFVERVGDIRPAHPKIADAIRLLARIDAAVKR